MGLFSFIENLFGGKSISKMSFYKLHSRLSEWKTRKNYPYAYELPDKIFLAPKFWTQTIRLYKDTRADEMERAISVFWADNELVLSSATIGNRKSVTPSNNIRISYTPDHKGEYYKREIFLDDRRVSQKSVYKSKVPKKLEVQYLFNMHTHPPHFDRGQQQIYSFFSAQDIKSLLSSGAVITGMIGDKLWILFRTAQTPVSIGDLTDYNISIQSLWEKLKIVTYKAEFKQALTKITDTKVSI